MWTIVVLLTIKIVKYTLNNAFIILIICQVHVFLGFTICLGMIALCGDVSSIYYQLLASHFVIDIKKRKLIISMNTNMF